MTSDLDIHRSAKLLIDPPGDYGVALVWKSSPAVANVCNGSEDDMPCVAICCHNDRISTAKQDTNERKMDSVRGRRLLKMMSFIL